MSVGGVQYKDFDEYLRKTGNEDKVNNGGRQNSGFTNGIPNQAINFAQDNDIFSADKLFGPQQTSDKENSGAGAASSGGGNFFNNIISGAATWVVNTIDGGSQTGDLAAAATGHSPVTQQTATPSGLTGTTGNENSGPQGGATSDQHDVYSLYQQFLDEQNEAKIADENGESQPTGDATLGTTGRPERHDGSDSAGEPDGANEADGGNKAPDGTGNPGTPTGNSGDVNDNNNNNNPDTGNPNDPANNNNSGDINRYEENKREKQDDENRRFRQPKQDEQAA
ncbi:MAG: hypothetical protein LUB59_07740 [Candidatus Gastranaerophilales bacterium]|nr:hypothetical protein [Candidatus Gastranaerophilales bacterium]